MVTGLLYWFMSFKIETKKYSADTLVLFGMLVFGLVIAQLLVFVTKGVRLSDPIELSGTGVSFR